jgi:UDP-2,3-diacylglucosamine pyrophosphatase LpxH
MRFAPARAKNVVNSTRLDRPTRVTPNVLLEDAAMTLDAIILSDLHLGSANCQAKALVAFLESVAEGAPAIERLILNGDVFDSFDFRRLKKNHWKVLSLLRKLSDQIEITWICGNHDGSAEIISHLLGVAVRDEYVFRSGGRDVLVLHGHTFDDFIIVHPVLTWFADCIYALLQWIDGTHQVARMAKRGSKTFVRCMKKIQAGSIEYARSKGCSAVCCGHTHLPEVHAGSHRDVEYFNSGCWTETPSTYLTVAAGHIELHRFVSDDVISTNVASDSIFSIG